MTRFALTIEFDGGPYMGWQWQDHGPSVQGTIEEAIFKTTGEKTLVYSAAAATERSNFSLASP